MHQQQAQDVRQFYSNYLNRREDPNTKFFNQVLLQLKYISPQQFTDPSFNKIVEELLETAKGSRLQLRMIAYALLSGSRCSKVLPSAEMRFLLFMINDPSASNENIVKLIRKAFEAKQKEWIKYPPSIVTNTEQNLIPEETCFEDEALVTVTHGGGLFFLLEFLRGNASGYKAPSEFEGEGDICLCKYGE